MDQSDCRLSPVHGIFYLVDVLIWLRIKGHAKGSDDTDTQPIPAYQSTTFGGHAASVGPEELSNTVIEEASEAVEEEVECECQNHDDRENLVCQPLSAFAYSNL